MKKQEKQIANALLGQITYTVHALTSVVQIESHKDEQLVKHLVDLENRVKAINAAFIQAPTTERSLSDETKA